MKTFMYGVFTTSQVTRRIAQIILWTTTLLTATALLSGGMSAATARGDTNTDRLWCNATINGLSARMQFDTGASVAAILSNSLARFNLRYVPLPETERRYYPPIVIGKTEPCDFGFGDETHKAELLVCSSPPQFPAAEDTGDGVLGWSNFRSNVIALNVGRSGFSIVPKIPSDTSGYVPFRIDTNETVLTLTTQLNTNQDVRIAVDTGASLGLRLPPGKWKQWKEVHALQPVTVAAFWGQRGTVVAEQGWADKYSIGPLT